jgi:DNA-binding NarL/FixJ family response regulator
VHLTARQQQVAELVARGWATKQIAPHLGITEQRVRQIIAAIGETIGANRGSDVRVAIALWFRSRAA